LGVEFLPFLPIIMSHLFAAMLQDVTADDVQLDEDADDRSDIQLVESDKGWVAIRTAAVEEQASACQLVVLLVERLQEHFYPFVQDAVTNMAPLLDSTHEDVRAFSLVIMPELVRSTAKANVPDKGPTVALVNFILGRLINSIRTEDLPELIMTGLQSVKLCVSYACTDWASIKAKCAAAEDTSLLPGGGGAGSRIWNQEPPRLTPSTSLPFLNDVQMKELTDCLMIVIRDCVHRRAILKAEAQVSAPARVLIIIASHTESYLILPYQISGAVDDNDAADEHIFLAEYMEMQYTVAEVVGSLFRTHGAGYLPTYLSTWHVLVWSMSEEHCLKEDRQFAFGIISELVDFGFSGLESSSPHFSAAHELLGQVIPRIFQGCGSSSEVGVRQTCAYTIGVLAEKHSAELLSRAMPALQALAACVAAGEDPPAEMKGASTDNAVASLGIVLERMEHAGLSVNFSYLWGQWIGYGLLQFDTVRR
jgi:hypothetical protein